MNTKKYLGLSLVGEFLGVFCRVFRSFLFNVLMFALGFGACYAYAVQRIDSADIKTERVNRFGYSIEAGISRLKARIIADTIASDSVRQTKEDSN